MSESVLMPDANKDPRKMPGHWILAKLGKKVLRPGGREMTQVMLGGLNIGFDDHVVEFAPGMGFTARLCLQHNPKQYIAIEQNEQAAAIVRDYLSPPTQTCLVGNAQETGLAHHSATVVYGEAMLTMQSEAKKKAIVDEAARVLKAKGRYGIHELCIVPDNIDEALKREIQKAIAQAIQAPAKPITAAEWKACLAQSGFETTLEHVAPMHLLEPKRIIEDEGFAGALKFALNVARYPQERARVLAMRKVFNRYQANLAAITLVAEKKDEM
ncbi:methyltransferase domain-containing protein [Vibrio sp. TRT 17S01]|uniref:methyltransferase domain-containing protein n=1 Tax=Vibrio sp. TRT 17S01 TaxID=3418505 RepID=UPI003CE97E95